MMCHNIIQLITQRSQVQVLSPLPGKTALGDSPGAVFILCLFVEISKSRSDRFHRQEQMKRIHGGLEKLRMMTIESPGFIIARVHQ